MQLLIKGLFRRQVLECASPLCTLHGSSTAHGPVRTHTSPSPQPSPLGRGRTISHRSTNQGPRNRRTRAQGRSLSPRERVGVRGKQVCECELASEASDACKAQRGLSSL